MKDLLSYIISSITGTSAEIVEEQSDGIVNFRVTLPKDQIGIVIGRGGRTINAIKNVLKIRAIREGVHVDIEVAEAV